MAKISKWSLFLWLSVCVCVKCVFLEGIVVISPFISEHCFLRDAVCLVVVLGALIPAKVPITIKVRLTQRLLRFGVRTAVSEQNSPLSRCDNLLFYCCVSYTFSEPSIIQTSTLRVYFVYSFESSVVLMRTVNSEACGLSWGIWTLFLKRCVSVELRMTAFSDRAPQTKFHSPPWANTAWTLTMRKGRRQKGYEGETIDIAWPHWAELVMDDRNVQYVNNVENYAQGNTQACLLFSEHMFLCVVHTC